MRVRPVLRWEEGPDFFRDTPTAISVLRRTDRRHREEGGEHNGRDRQVVVGGGVGTGRVRAAPPVRSVRSGCAAQMPTPQPAQLAARTIYVHCGWGSGMSSMRL